MKPIVLLLGILWASVQAVVGQQFQYSFYTEKDGLSNKAVSSLAIDQQGFLWVGTSFGLNRFDGNEFEQFYNDPADSGSIADNNIQTLFMDAESRLWIGTNAGISLYHPQAHRFSNYTPGSDGLAQRGISFGALCEDPAGNIWVGMRNELLIFHPADHRFISSGWGNYAAAVAPANGNRGRVIVLGLIKKDRDELWILSTYGLFSVNTGTREFHYYPCRDMEDFYGCRLNYADNLGNVWITALGNNLLSFNIRTGLWSCYHVGPGPSSSAYSPGIVRFSGDTLMYKSPNAFVLFDAARKKTFPPMPYGQAETGYFKDASFNTLIHSPDMIWLGTSNGLARTRTSKELLRFVPLTEKGNTARVFSIPYNNDLLFSSFQKGFTTYLVSKGRLPDPVRIATGGTLHSSYQFYAVDRKGRYYVNDDEHFYSYDPLSNLASLIPFPPKENPGVAYDVRNMVVDRDGMVWIRTLGQGILVYDPGRNIVSGQREIPLTKNKEVNALYYDSLTNTIWAAEEFNGVYVYDVGKKQTRHLALTKPGSQRSGSIAGITGDGNGNIWLIDLQAGLVEYNHARQSFSRYTVNDGLASNNCYGLVRDSRGMIWINTDEGLTEYDPAAHIFTSFGRNEGLPDARESYLSADAKGNIYFPYKNGFYSWNIDAVTPPSRDDILYIRDIQLFDTHLPMAAEYRFSAGENNIRFLFGILSYKDRVRPKLEYKLNRNGWLTVDLHSYISFANLAPGSYDLYVRIKNEQLRDLHITFLIKKPYWQTVWFLGLILAAIAGSVILINRVRLQRERKESSLREKIMESEMSALRSQMNPHFIFNTLNSINSYIIENKKDEASDYLSDFSKLMRLILDHSKKRTITLTDELYALKLYIELESRRLDSSFDYSIEIGPAVDADSITMPPLVIQPFVENAIWHGLRGRKSGGHITIRINRYNYGILILVEDDGIGRTAAGNLQNKIEGDSFGSTATTQRILLNDPLSKVVIEDLYTTENMAAGTRVSIYVNQNSR
ncbi:MAG: histidine kinase [Chitinophagaceae bacterium]|nr:histidine kinase [Chitinophagaceae bacterium]